MLNVPVIALVGCVGACLGVLLMMFRREAAAAASPALRRA
jgi:hypothetical protein